MSEVKVDVKLDIKIPDPDQEEIYLEKLVFGDEEGFANNLKNIDNLYEDDDFDDDIYKNNQFNFSDDDDNDDFLGSLSNKENLKVNDGMDDDDDDADNNDDEMSKLNDDQLFFVDSDAGDKNGDEMDLDSEAESSDNNEESDANAWKDSDDEDIEISLISSDKLKKLRKSETESQIDGNSYIKRLRNQFERIFPKPEWSSQYEENDNNNNNYNSDNGSDSEENKSDKFDQVGSANKTIITASNNPLMDFLNTNQTYNITNKTSRLLNPENIDIDRLTDANISKISKSSVQSIDFHKNHPLMLTGGFDRTLRIYHIDGKHNNLITSLHLRQSPIQTCIFSNNENDNNSIFAGGRRKYMFKWNIDNGFIEKITRMYGNENHQKSFEYFKQSTDGKLIALSGNSGWINLLSAKTGQYIKGFKIEGTLIDFEFTSNNCLIVINTYGEIWEFSLENFQLIKRWKDENAIGITKIKVSQNNRWLAVGSNNGIVNVYDRLKDNKLVKSITNLTTTISSLEFNYDGQILCIASRDKRDALKLVHLPSCKVFKNWPTSATPLGKVTAIKFSPNSTMLATGNDAGKVRLWRISHY